METVKRKKLTAGRVAMFVLALMVQFAVVSCGGNTANDNYAALVTTSEALNKTYPVKVDADTRIDSTNVQKEPLTLNYYYTVVTLDKDSVTVAMEDVVKELKKGTQENLDTAPAMKEFRERDIALKYCYYDKNGAFLVDYTIRPSKAAHNIKSRH